MTKRKGIITIDKMESETNSNLIYSVDFEGHNEGSGNPCKSEEEVNEVVKRLKADKQAEYNLEVIDRRKKETQALLGTTIKHDKVAVIKARYGLDGDWERDWRCDVEGTDDFCHVSYHSSGGYNCKDKTLEGKLEHLIKELKAELLEKGFKEENIKVEKTEITEEERIEWAKTLIEREQDSIIDEEKDVSRARKELLKAINNLKTKKEKLEKLKEVVKTK